MKVVLVGEKYSTNLGDGVIFQTVRAMVKSFVPKAVLYDLDISGRITYDDNIEWLLSSYQRLAGNLVSVDHARALLVRRRLLQLIRDNRQIDAIIFVGGQLFMDYFTPAIYELSKVANKAGIAVIFNACGVGAMSHQSVRQLKKALGLPCVRAVSIRDGDVSQVSDIFSSCRLKPDVVTDPVVELADYVTTNFSRPKHQKLGINIMSPWVSWRDHPEEGNAYTKQLLRNILAFCKDHSISWEIYSNGGSDDNGYISGMCQQMNIDPKHIADFPHNPDDLVRCIAGYSHIIGFRMHTHIIAHALGIPTIGFLWDEKLRHYAERTHQVSQFLYMKESVSANIANQLTKLMARHTVSVEIDSTTSSSQFIKRSLDLV